MKGMNVLAIAVLSAALAACGGGGDVSPKEDTAVGSGSPQQPTPVNPDAGGNQPNQPSAPPVAGNDDTARGAQPPAANPPVTTPPVSDAPVATPPSAEPSPNPSPNPSPAPVPSPAPEPTPPVAVTPPPAVDPTPPVTPPGFREPIWGVGVGKDFPQVSLSCGTGNPWWPVNPMTARLVNSIFVIHDTGRGLEYAFQLDVGSETYFGNNGGFTASGAMGGYKVVVTTDNGQITGFKYHLTPTATGDYPSQSLVVCGFDREINPMNQQAQFPSGTEVAWTDPIEGPGEPYPNQCGRVAREGTKFYTDFLGWQPDLNGPVDFVGVLANPILSGNPHPTVRVFHAYRGQSPSVTPLNSVAFDPSGRIIALSYYFHRTSTRCDTILARDHVVEWY